MRRKCSVRDGVLPFVLLFCALPSVTSFGVTTVQLPVDVSSPSTATPATKLHAHGGYNGDGRKHHSVPLPTPSSPNAPAPAVAPSSAPRHSKTRLDAYRAHSVLDAGAASPRRGSGAILELSPGSKGLRYPSQNVQDEEDDMFTRSQSPLKGAGPGGKMTPSQLATLLHQAVKDLVTLRSPGGSSSRREVDHRQALFADVRDLVGKCPSLMPHMNPETIATVLNSLSKLPPNMVRELNVLDGGRQQSPFWAAFLQRMHALVPRFGPRCLATVINALAKLRSSVGPSLVPLDRVLTRRLAEQCRKHFGTEAGFTTQGLSNVINGFAKLGFHPGRQWLRDFCTEVANQIHDMGPQAVSNVINGLGKLKYRPNEQVLQTLAQRSHAILIQFNPQGLANLLNGFARLSPPYHPGNDFLSDLRDESLWRLAGFESRGLAALAHGFSAFGYHPGEVFLDSFGQAMAKALSGRSESGGYDEITGWTLCTTYNGLGKLAWRPPAAAAGLWTATLKWLESHGGAASALEPQQVSQLLWSLCALGPPPEAEPLFHYLLHEAALLVTRGGWENCIADRQLRQVVLFCHLVGPPVLRTAAGELRHALETNKKMVGSGAACCREDGEQGSEEEGGREAPPMSSHFHLEVLRCLTQTIGAWDPTTEVDDGVYIQDIVLRSVSRRSDGRANGDETKPLLPVIIEVDGPAHFFSNDVRRPRGDHCLKARILKAQAGWTHAGVVSVAWFEWADKTHDERARMIRAKLDKLVGEEDLGAYIDLSRYSPFASPALDLFQERLLAKARRQQEHDDDDVSLTFSDEEDVVVDVDGNVRSTTGLWGLTVVELKAMLRVRNLAVSGRKQDLVRRLQATDLSLPAAA